MSRLGGGLLVLGLAGVAIGCSFDSSSQGTEGASSGSSGSSGPVGTGISDPTTSTSSSSGLDSASTTTTGSVDTTGDTGSTGESSTGAQTTTGDETEGEAKEVEYCTVAGLPIPDDNRAGISSSVDVDLAGGGSVVSLELLIQASHTYVGDLRFDLRKDTAEVLVIDRPDGGGGNGSCSTDDIDVVLRDDAADSVDQACAGGSPALSGVLRPVNLMDPVFAGMQMLGTWRLRVTDGVAGDGGSLDSWCLRITYR